MNPITLEDMAGNMFGEGDHVIFADQLKSLRIARVRGIKPSPSGHGFSIALEIVVGIDANRKRYSRSYIQHDFYKVDYISGEGNDAADSAGTD